MKEIDVSVIVQEVLNTLSEQPNKASSNQQKFSNTAKTLTADDYPLQEKNPEKILSVTGMPLTEITFQNYLNGKIQANDLRIAPETLEMQAQIAENTGRAALANNMRRAAEMIAIPDERVLEIYNALRPNRSSKAELLQIAEELEQKYQAVIVAKHVREAAEVYEERQVLRRD